MSEREILTEDWLRTHGFKWHQLERQSSKNWMLWLGDTVNDGWTSFEDLGVEVAMNLVGREQEFKDWFCWLRADTSHRYSRFIHVRHIRYVDELVGLIEGLTGVRFNPENVFSGSLRTAESAHRLRVESNRLDHKWITESKYSTWREIEKDDSRQGALPEHMQSAIDTGKAT